MSRSYPIRVANRAVRFPPRARRLLLVGIDALLLPLAVWLSFWLRLAHPFHPSFLAAGSWLLLAVLLVGLPLYAFTGQYKGLSDTSVVRRSIALPAATDCWCCYWRVSV